MLLRGEKPLDLLGGSPDPGIIDVGINFGSKFDAGVSHKLLCGPDIDAALCEVGAIGVPEAVGHEILGEREGRYELVAVCPASHREVHFAFQSLYNPRVGTIFVRFSVRISGDRGERRGISILAYKTSGMGT